MQSSEAAPATTTASEFQIHPRLDAFVIMLIVCSSIFITTFFIYLQAVSAQKGEIREGLARSTDIISATLIDTELHKTLVSQDQKTSPDYIKAIQPFLEIQKKDPALKYVWTAVMRENKIYFVLDPAPPSAPDAVKVMEEYKDAPPEIYEAFKGKKTTVSKEPYSDQWGTFITAYSPVFDKDNTVIAVLGATIDVKNYLERLQPIKFATARALVTGLSVSLLMALGTWFMRRFAVEINKSRMAVMERLRITVVTDALTGLFNRRYFDTRYTALFAEAREKNLPLTVIMTDVDHFKKVNDTYGHVPGDEVLQQVARRLMQSVRTTDMVARYGGEEFVILLPNTDMEAAMSIGERVRIAVEEEPFKISAGDGILPKTTSLGIAILREDDTLGSLLKRADAGLYVAKEGGRNMIGVAS